MLPKPGSLRICYGLFVLIQSCNRPDCKVCYVDFITLDRITVLAETQFFISKHRQSLYAIKVRDTCGVD